MYFFCELDGDTVGIDAYAKIEADTFEEAQARADELSEENYSEYDDPFEGEDEDEPRFTAVVTEWDETVHAEYYGQPRFTDYTS